MLKARLMWVCVVLLGGVACGWAKLPATVDEFKARMETDGKEPKTAAHLWFEALYVWLSKDDDTKAKGREMVSLLASKDEEDWERTLLSRGTLQKQPYLFNSYAKGATPANDYKMDPNNFELEFTTDKLEKEGKQIYLMVKCGGGRPAPAVPDDQDQDGRLEDEGVVQPSGRHQEAGG